MSEKVKKERKGLSSLKLAKDTLGYFFPIAWKFKKSYFILTAIMTATTAATPFVSIAMTPLLINEIVGDKDPRKLILYALILVLGEGILSAISSTLSIYLGRYQTLYDNYFAEELGRRVMGLDFQLTEDKDALDQLEKGRTGMEWYSGGVVGLAAPFFDVISYVIQLLGVVVLISMTAPILLLVMVILLLIQTYLRGKTNKVELEAFKQLSKLNRIFGYLLFRIGGFEYGKDIRLYGAKEMMLEKASSSSNDLDAAWEWQANGTLKYGLMMSPLNIIRLVITYLYLGIITILGKITLGVFSQMLTACGTFSSALSALMSQIQTINMRVSYANEYVKFMEYPAATEKGDRHVKDSHHTIEFKNVTFSYPKTDTPVLKDVSITLRQGEHLSVVGLNGAGKTTFIKLLCRLYDIDSGEILLDGVNIKEYDYDEYIKLFSVVFQDFKLFAFSARDNVTLGNEPDKTVTEDVIEKVGLSNKFGSLPSGLDTMIFKEFEESGIEPSGGEQQKLAIARALYKNSPVVILDEPTAALDPVAEYEIYRQFHSLVGGRTAVYISHRLSSCRFCDRIAVFSDGTIKELGTHDELVEIPNGVYAKMFAAQAKYYT